MRFQVAANASRGAGKNSARNIGRRIYSEPKAGLYESAAATYATAASDVPKKLSGFYESVSPGAQTRRRRMVKAEQAHSSSVEAMASVERADAAQIAVPGQSIFEPAADRTSSLLYAWGEAKPDLCSNFARALLLSKSVERTHGSLSWWLPIN